jgi:hypothetical protein
MCRGSSSACRKPSENRTQLDPRRARPPPSRAPPHPPPGEAAAPCRRACGPRPACGPGAGVASPRCRDSHARSCARGVLTWRRRSGLSGKGRSCAEGAVPWGTPRELMPASVRVEQGWRPPPLAMQDGAGDHGTREHMSTTLQSGRAVDLKKSTQVLGSVRYTVRRIAALSAVLSVRWETARLSASVVVARIFVVVYRYGSVSEYRNFTANRNQKGMAGVRALTLKTPNIAVHDSNRIVLHLNGTLRVRSTSACFSFFL